MSQAERVRPEVWVCVCASCGVSSTYHVLAHAWRVMLLIFVVFTVVDMCCEPLRLELGELIGGEEHIVPLTEIAGNRECQCGVACSGRDGI